MAEQDGVYQVGAVNEYSPEEWPVRLFYERADRRKLVACESPTGTVRDQEFVARVFTWGAKKFFSNCPPRSVTRQRKNVLNSVNPKPIFLDCGRWGGSGEGCKYPKQRNFALIHGRHVVLCNFHYASGAPNVLDMPVIDYDMIDKFLKHLHKPITGTAGNLGVHWVTIIKHATVDRALVKYLKSKDLYVILPDLHLPIVTKMPELKKGTEIYIDDMGFMNPGKVRTAKVIDDNQPSMGRTPYGPGGISRTEWFKSYLQADIFGKQAGEDLAYFLQLVGEFSAAKEKVHLVQLGDMYELWIGLRRYFTKQKHHRVVLTNRKIGKISPEEFISYWVKMANKNYSSVISTFNDIEVKAKTWLYGNHDNYLAPSVCPAGLVPKRSKEYFKHGLLMEHGHASDSYNSDGAIDGHELTQDVFEKPYQRSFDPNRRWLWTTHAAVRWMADPKIAIYVMAHTHSPFMTKLDITGKVQVLRDDIDEVTWYPL